MKKKIPEDSASQTGARQTKAHSQGHSKPDGERVFPRIEIPLWKHVKLSHQRDERFGFVKNISLGGFFVELEDLYEPGVQLEFQIHVPEPVNGSARVVWKLDQVRSGENPGVGLEFTELTSEASDTLSQVIEDYLGPLSPISPRPRRMGS